MKLLSHLSYFIYWASGKRSFKKASLLLTRYRFSQKKTIRILEQAGAIFNKPATIRSPVFIDEGAKLVIGERVFINFALTVIGTGKITIERNSLIGPNVTLITASHHMNPEQRLADRSAITNDIHIGENVWIGANVTVCPGVSISNNTTIGTGSVVTKNIPDNVFAAGNPCTILRNFCEPEKLG